jgi:hypothetical protein
MSFSLDLTGFKNLLGLRSKLKRGSLHYTKSFNSIIIICVNLRDLREKNWHADLADLRRFQSKNSENVH